MSMTGQFLGEGTLSQQLPEKYFDSAHKKLLISNEPK